MKVLIACVLGVAGLLIVRSVIHDGFRQTITAATTDRSSDCLTLAGSTTREEEGFTYIVGAVRNRCETKFTNVTVAPSNSIAPTPKSRFRTLPYWLTPRTSNPARRSSSSRPTISTRRPRTGSTKSPLSRSTQMMIVRNSFVAKPGQASKLAALLKDVSTLLPNARVLTDVTGDFNRVVMEYEVATVADFEARMQQYATDPQVRTKMQGYTDLWVTGSREILKVV